MKQETRGRKPKIHKPLGATFNEVLGAIAGSKYREEKKLKTKKK